MALFDTKLKPSSFKKDDMSAKIQQRRYQILVHSLLYYELDFNLVSDSKWSEWANELVKLQTDNPDIASTVIFANAFKDFDGSTGFDLPYRDEQIIHIARRLLKDSNEPNAKTALNRLMLVAPARAEYKGFYDKYPSKAPSKPIQPQRKAVKKVETHRKKLF